MPRPKKRGFMYFPLDTDFFLDENVKLLRRSYGSAGVLTYINLMCKIYRNGYYYCFDDILYEYIYLKKKFESENKE